MEAAFTSNASSKVQDGHFLMAFSTFFNWTHRTRFGSPSPSGPVLTPRMFSAFASGALVPVLGSVARTQPIGEVMPRSKFVHECFVQCNKRGHFT
jgi:hypothetical protein